MEVNLRGLENGSPSISLRQRCVGQFITGVLIIFGSETFKLEQGGLVEKQGNLFPTWSPIKKTKISECAKAMRKILRMSFGGNTLSQTEESGPKEFSVSFKLAKLISLD